MREKSTPDILVFTDGACCGNPGPAGIGAVIAIAGSGTLELSEYIGPATNNIAELSAIERVLKYVEGCGLRMRRMRILSDSRYVIGVLTNPDWHPKKNQMLICRIKKEMKKFPLLEIDYIPRERNQADRLAKKAARSMLLKKGDR